MIPSPSLSLHEIEAGLNSEDLETCSLQRLIYYKAFTHDIISTLGRSAREIKKYMILYTPEGDLACTEAQDLKNELVSRIQDQAKIYRDHLKSIDEEINKRLDK